MEITYEKFNLLDAGYSLLEKIFTHRVSQLAILEDKTGVSFNKYSDNESKLWHAQANEIDEYYTDDLFDFEVVEEINKNVVNIESDGQVKRYLENIKSKLMVTQEMVFGILDYHDLNQKSYKRLCSEMIKSSGVDMKTLEVTGPITDLRISYLRVTGGLEDIMYRIDEHLNPNRPQIFSVELEKNTHKLLLMYKTGVFEALYNKYYQHLGAVKFSRLIASMLGVEQDKHEGFRPSVNDLIKEMLVPASKKAIQTPAAENKVNSFLAEIGIES